MDRKSPQDFNSGVGLGRYLVDEIASCGKIPNLVEHEEKSGVDKRALHALAVYGIFFSNPPKKTRGAESKRTLDDETRTCFLRFAGRIYSSFPLRLYNHIEQNPSTSLTMATDAPNGKPHTTRDSASGHSLQFSDKTAIVTGASRGIVIFISLEMPDTHVLTGAREPASRSS